MRIQEELRAIDEEAMYQAPATTYRAINKAADLLDEAERVVEGLFAVAAFGKFERDDDEPPPLPEHSFDVAMQNARAFLAKLRKEKDDVATD